MSGFTTSARLGGVGTAAVGLMAAFLLSTVSVKAAVGLLGACFAIWLIAHPDAAFLIFIGAAPFEHLLLIYVSGATIKVLGGCVIIGWLIRPAPDTARARLVFGEQIVVFLLVIGLMSLLVSEAGAGGLIVYLRYLAYGALYLVASRMLGLSLSLTSALQTFVVSCALAGAVGAVGFFLGFVDRARGPLENSDDFAFVLMSAIPIAFGLSRATGKRWWALLAVPMLIGTAATLSRGAGVALFAIALWSIGTRVVRLRTALALVALTCGIAAILLVWQPGPVRDALVNKQAIAASNVNTRFQRWDAAVLLMAQGPLLGAGPGGFEQDYTRLIPNNDPALNPPGDVAHNMYLQLGAEFGVPAMLMLVAFLIWSAAVARRMRLTAPSSSDRALAAGLEASLVESPQRRVF